MTACKFKVGDKVEVVDPSGCVSEYKTGEVGAIKVIEYDSGYNLIRLEGKDGGMYDFRFKMYEPKWECNGVEFKIGDKVKIVRKVETDAPNGMGNGVIWNNAWTYEMDNMIGREFTIEIINNQGVCDNDYGFGYPLSSLENLSAKKEEPMKEEKKFSIKDIIKPWMRVQTRGEGMWLAVEVGGEVVLTQTGEYAWNKIKDLGKYGFECYDIVAVYDNPSPYAAGITDVTRLGSLVWKLQTEKEKRIEALEKELAELKGE